MAAGGSNIVIGIRREDKNKWERRTPLTPDNVKQLIKEIGCTVLVQPSSRRVFPDSAYEDAGATLTEDLAPAQTILGVKEVPLTQLMSGKTYVMFSHTIKAQPDNMALLDSILDKKIRLLDYECITESGQRGDKRLVAFGRYAGIAGAIDFMRGLGARCLSLSFSTPFMHVPSAYMCASYGKMQDAVREAGVAIREQGLPAPLCPFVVGFTGSGNVSKGAQEVWKLLPHKYVSAEELPDLHARAAQLLAGPATRGAKRASPAADGGQLDLLSLTREELTSNVFLVEVGRDHMVQLGAAEAAAEEEDGDTAMDGGAAAGNGAKRARGAASAERPAAPSVPKDCKPVDRTHYYAHPDEYQPVFHEVVVPYLSGLMNCMYWDQRFPRLLTNQQALELDRQGRLRLIGISDITCDPDGSIEMLQQLTSIEKPFFIFDVKRSRIIEDDMDAPGVLYHAVDHLPSEMPREASEHFGERLTPLLPSLLGTTADEPWDDASKRLRAEVAGAIVTCNGQLTPQFGYIAKLRASRDKAERGQHLAGVGGPAQPGLARQASFVTMRLVGHIFDTGAINSVLDTVEEFATQAPSSYANILDVAAGRDTATSSSATMQLFAPKGHLPQLVQTIKRAATSLDIAVEMGGGGSVNPQLVARLARSASPQLPRRILLLGSGLVTPPLVSYLLRQPANHITVASFLFDEAKALCAGKPRLTAMHLDVMKEPEKLERLVGEHDVVISLVPPPLHPRVAAPCVAKGRHMVTASYVSPAMMELHEQAKAKGVCLINEVGLDPGIDHMSAMAMMDDIRAKGGVIRTFESNCGGLPAPEAAGNPLGYKFSWAPRGVLTAARNTALFRRSGEEVSVAGPHLLHAAVPFRAGPAFALEVLPNRNSMPYVEKYSLAAEALQTMRRGTLRYQGYSFLLGCMAAIGWLRDDSDALLANIGGEGAPSLNAWLCQTLCLPPGSSADAVVAAVLGRWSSVQAQAVATGASLLPVTAAPQQVVQLREFLGWLGAFSEATPLPALSQGAKCDPHARPLDVLVALLVAKKEMHYAPGERDMTLMQHTCEVDYPAGSRGNDEPQRVLHTSTMVEYGDGTSTGTAMARTVGLTAAIATQLVLDQGCVEAGVCTPVTARWYKPILAALQEEGIGLTETERVL